MNYMLSRSPNTPLHNLDTNETPLIAACRHDNVDIARLLLEHSPKLVFVPEARNNLTPFHVACSRGNLAMVDLVIQTIKVFIYSDDFDQDSELSLDFRDQLGRTPLYNACYYGFHDIAKRIVGFYKEHSDQVSLDVNAALKGTNRTPIHAAVRKGNMDTIRLLLSMSGADLSLEARPSGRTQARLVTLYQMACGSDSISKMSPLNGSDRGVGRDHQRISSSVVEIEFKDTRESMVTPELLSPPGTRTPTLPTGSSSIYTDSWSTLHSSSSSSSLATPLTPLTPLHIDDSVGITAPSPSAVASQKMSSSIECSSNQFGSMQRIKRPKNNMFSEALPQKNLDMQLEGVDSMRKRSRTEEPLDDGNMPTKSCLVVFECKKTGRLEIFKCDKDSDESGYKKFGSIFMTPLAEAVACGYSKVARYLLACGARDESGIACRIAHFIKKPVLVHSILSYHTMLRDSSFMASSPKLENSSTAGTSSTAGSEELELCLELQWSYKQLAVCEGSWLSPGSKFRPVMSKDQEERRNLLMGEDSIRSKSEKDVSSMGSQASLEDTVSVKSMPMVMIESLRIVQLDNNQLQTLPIELFRLQNVIKIDVSHNKLASLPSTVVNTSKEGQSSGWTVPNLKELNLSHNSLTFLPWCIWGLPKIKTFRCSRNKLVSLYPEAELESDEILTPSLETMDISQNSLSGLFPDFVFDLPGLRSLNISDNRINELPLSMWDTDVLQDLNVSNNALVCLPLCESEHEYRKSISISGSSYAAPVSIQQADKVLVGRSAIKAAKIDRNKSIYNKAPSTIRGISSGDIASWSTAGVSNEAVLHTCTYSALQRLNLSGNKITVFPEALACFAPNLLELDISRNSGLQEIDIKYVPYSLKKLTAKKCGLQRIGNVEGRKQQLLAVQNCRHGEDIGKACSHRSHNRLPWLTMLVLAQNKISRLQLIRLPQPESSQEWLEMVETEYQPKIAPSLDLLYPALEGLNMSSNLLIGMFNPNIGHHTHLKWVHLNGNSELTGVPMEFAYLKNTKMLTELKIGDLPSLIEPPVEYQTVGLNHLLTYMRSRLKK